MALNNLLLNGGRVLIVGGMNKSWSSYRQVPQFEFWSGDQKEIHRALRDREIPANCKAVVISRFISHSELNRVLSQARKRGIVIFANKADGEVANILDEMTLHLKNGATMTVQEGERKTPVDSVDTRQLPEATSSMLNLPTPKNPNAKLHALIPFVDFNKSNAENARLLLQGKAKELGLKTTEASIAQYVRVLRGRLNAPKSPAVQAQRNRGNQYTKRRIESAPIAVIQKVTDKIIEKKVDLTVKMLDGMIADLQGMRDFLISVTDENNTLKAKLAKLKEVFE